MDKETRVAKAQVLEFVALFVGVAVLTGVVAYFEKEIEEAMKEGGDYHESQTTSKTSNE